jgi:hypothetical protein
LRHFSVKQPEIEAPFFVIIVGCSAQPGFQCNCSFARMTFDEM